MIDLKVVSPDGVIIEQSCKQVEIKTLGGVITILPKHTPLVSVINDGYIKVDKGEKITIKKALLTVNENSIVDILVSEK